MDYRGWLKLGLQKPGKTHRELAVRINRHPSTIAKMLAGSKKIETDWLPIISEYIEEPIPTNGTTKGDDPSTVTMTSASPSVTIPVEGKVEAGAFREAEMLAHVKPRTIVVPRDRRYPFAQPRAYEVHGDSMDLLGIKDGHTVYGVDFAGSGAALANYMIVVIERSRDGLVERSLKEVHVTEDYFEFRPRSSNPTHESFFVPRRWSGEDFEPGYQILALIRNGVYSLD
jgi:hypothetical protein